MSRQYVNLDGISADNVERGKTRFPTRQRCIGSDNAPVGGFGKVRCSCQ